MKIVKRIVFWLLLVEFTAACVWWIFTFPYRPDRLYGAIPPEAAWVTDHAELAARWSGLMRCPTLRAALEAGGMEAGRAAALDLDTPAVRRLVERFCARRTLVAAVPPGPTGASGLVVVTWAGRQAQYLRLGMMDRYLSGVKTVRLGGEKLWQWQGGGVPAGRTVSVAVYEGMVIACLSPDPMAAARLRLRASGAPPPPAWIEPASAAADASFASARDRAWVRVPGNRPWRIVLEETDEGGCRGKAMLAGMGEGLPTRAYAACPGAVDLPVPPGTVALGAVAAGDASAWIARASLPPPVKDAVRLVAERHVRADAPLVAWAASGDWSGRVMSLRVPSLFLAVPVSGAAAAVAEATNVIDMLNAGMRTSYLPRNLQIEGVALTVFSSARQDQNDVVPAAEKPAMAAFGPWVVFCSNARTLGRALSAERVAPPHAAIASLTHAPGAAALWIDTAPAVDAARNLRGVYELWLLLQNPAKPPFSRGELSRLDPWFGRLAPFGQVSLALGSADGHTAVEFDIRTHRPSGSEDESEAP